VPSLDFVGNLLEAEPFRRQTLGREAAGFAEHQPGAGVVGPQGLEGGQHGGGEHVAASRAAVAENAVVEQGDGRALVLAQERRRFRAARRRPGTAGFLIPDPGGQGGEADFRVDAAVGEKHRLAQGEEAEAAAALPAQGLRNAAWFAGHYLLQARQAMGGGMLAHLDADIAPAHLVGHGGGGAGAEEGIEHEVAGVGGDLQYPRNQQLRLWRNEVVCQ